MLVLMLFWTTVSKLRSCLGNSCFIPEAGAASTVAMSMKAATAAMMRGRKVLLESILVVLVIRMKMGKERRGAVFKHFEFFLFWYGYSWVDFLVAIWANGKRRCAAHELRGLDKMQLVEQKQQSGRCLCPSSVCDSIQVDLFSSKAMWPVHAGSKLVLLVFARNSFESDGL